jgi:hypothetical protein
MNIKSLRKTKGKLAIFKRLRFRLKISPKKYYLLNFSVILKAQIFLDFN